MSRSSDGKLFHTVAPERDLRVIKRMQYDRLSEQ